jgi:DNA-binding CsgD family transcriptional regulator
MSGDAEQPHRTAEDVRERFASSDDFFGWLRDHLVEEGQLTLAEEETCELLLLGRNYLEIAAARRVSLETIKWHVKRILRKLGVDSTRELLWVVGYRLDRRRGP